MKIAIIGGGFTGLTAAYYLSPNHEVFLYEKENCLGGLAASFKLSDWKWQVEQHYHHWFTSDHEAIGLINKLNLSDKLMFPKTLTSIFYKEKIYPFNTPAQILSFDPLSFPQRIRVGFVSLFLKLLPPSLAITLEKYPAKDWLRKYYGEKAYRIVWEPLLEGKFSSFADTVNMAWFWARIHKRTLKLGYLAGGYETLVMALANKIKSSGGKIFMSTPFDPKTTSKYDKVIITTPSFLYTKMYPDLPEDYKIKLNSIPHLTALNLLLITREKILDNTYWLNINDRSFPFIAVVAQTNMIDPQYYGGNHLTWIGNYLPSNHPYLKMTKEQLIHLYLPYIKKINPRFNSQLTTHNSQLFVGPFAQPVFGLNYSHTKPDFQTPIKNVYLANMDMVYPWDRGTNYAIEMGRKIAELILRSQGLNLLSN